MPDLGEASTANPALDGEAGITVHSVAPAKTPSVLSATAICRCADQPVATGQEPAAVNGLAGKQDRMVEPVLASTDSTANPAIAVRRSKARRRRPRSMIPPFAIMPSTRTSSGWARTAPAQGAASHLAAPRPVHRQDDITNSRVGHLQDRQFRAGARADRADAEQQSALDAIERPDDQAAAGEARALIKRALQMRRYTDVVDAARPIHRCWFAARCRFSGCRESLVRLKRHAEAFDLYKYILSTCENPAEGWQTVQKASLLMPAAACPRSWHSAG